MAFDTFYLTAAGTRYAARTASGGRLEITRAQFGDGIVTGDLTGQTALIHPLGAMTVSQAQADGNTVTVTTQFSNRSGDTVLAPFYLAEIGLFGRIVDDDTCPETLIAYANAGSVERADYIPAVLTEYLIYWPCTVSNAANVTVVIDNSLIYLTRADLLREIVHHMPIYVQAEEPQADGPFLWYDIGDTPPEPAPEMVLLQLGDASVGGEVYALIDDTQYTVENAEKANDPVAEEPLEITIY